MLFLLELFGFAVALCGIHALSARFGRAPLYLAIGFFQTMLFVADKGQTPISVELVGSTAFIGYSTYLPLLLGATVLVYVLDGSHAARALLVAIVVVHVLHGVADVLLAHHANHPPPGTPWLGDSVLVEHSLVVRAMSLAAFAVDFAVILVGYQLLANRLRRLPLIVPIYLATMAAMVSDAVVFSALYGLHVPLGSPQLLQKLEVVAVSALPIAGYIHVELRRSSGEVRRAILERGAFDVFELRRRVHEVETRLADTVRDYETVKRMFGRYVSHELVERIVADPSRLALGGEMRDVTVMFADIAGYTTLAERLPPTAVIDILNRYYEAVGRAIQAEGGMIVGIQGDSLLAAFGAPVSRADGGDHAGDAVRAARRMLAAVATLNDSWQQAGVAELAGDGLAIRIGIHSGPVVAGNVGSQERVEYTLIGDTVNTAARVEQLNKRFGTALLLTAATWERLDAALRDDLRDLGEHQVRGRKDAVHVFGDARPTAGDRELPAA